MTVGSETEKKLSDVLKDPIKARFHDRWQRIRRNPSYIVACQRVKFNEDGLPFLKNESPHGEDGFIPTEEVSDEVECLKFGLNILVDPDCDPFAPFILEGSVFSEGRAVKVLSYSFEMNQEGEVEHIPPLEDGKYLTVKIDVTRLLDKEIVPDIKKTVKESREFIDEGVEPEMIINRKTLVSEPRSKNLLMDQEGSNYKSRANFEKRMEYYEIWDWRSQGMAYEEIGLKTRKKNEKLSTAVDRAKKRYLVAHDLILGKKHKDGKPQREWGEGVETFCAGCKDQICLTDYEAGRAWRPCPPAVAAGVSNYLEQDTKKSTSALPVGRDPSQVQIKRHRSKKPGNE